MLHKKRVLTATYYSMRRRLRLALKLPQRQRPPPVLSQQLEAVVERHSGIVRTLLQNLPTEVNLAGKTVCEVGSGDCLAAISVFLGLGARRVEVVEMADPVINDKQRQVLETLKGQGLPIDPTIITPGNQLDGDRVRFHKTYMENFDGASGVDLIFSFSVMEHVEDLDGFYKASARIMTSGGYMLHIIDLGGHDVFEDPLPPLDFQTYSSAMYNLMFTKYCRATRRFLDEHIAAVERNGFSVVSVKPLRTASDPYLDQIWPKLRAEAQSRPRNDVGVIEFALLARKRE